MKLWHALNRCIGICFYALIFLTPVVFNPSRSLPSYELFEWNKMMLVYFFTTVIVSTWIGKMIVERRLIIARTPLDLPILLYLGSQILSTIFSIDRHVSIFGYYSRFHGGLLSTVCYVLLYYAFVSNREFISLRKLIQFALASGAAVAMYGIAEKFGIDAHMWVQDVRARVFSTLGQPNWLAAYLAILLPVAIKKTITQPEHSKPTLLVIGNWLLVNLFYVCLLLTKSRSGFLGFWIANAFFGAWIFYSSSERSESRSFLNKVSSRLRSNNILKPFIILNSSFLILNFFIRTPFSQYNQWLSLDLLHLTPPVVETAPVGDSIINVGITDSSKIRQIVWKGALAIADDYPLFGTGPETFAFAYYKYRPPDHNLTSEWDFLYNRAHNEFLNYAATSGWFGLAVYVFFIVGVFILGIRYLFKPIESKNKTLIVAMLASYLSIQITNFFGFSVVVVGLYLFLIPACIYAIVAANYTHNLSISELKQSQKILLAVLLLVTLFIFWQLVRFWIADSLYARAYSLSKQEDYEQALPFINDAIRFRSDEPVYFDELANISGNLAFAKAYETNDTTASAELIHQAVSASNQALTISPQNVSFWKTRTRIFYSLTTLSDPWFTEQALAAIKIAQELAPTDAKIAYNQAVLLGQAGKKDEAIAALKKTIELKPDYRDAYIALSIFYIEQKQSNEARAILNQVLEKIDPNDAEVKDRLQQLGSQ